MSTKNENVKDENLTLVDEGFWDDDSQFFPPPQKEEKAEVSKVLKQVRDDDEDIPLEKPEKKAPKAAPEGKSAGKKNEEEEDNDEFAQQEDDFFNEKEQKEDTPDDENRASDSDKVFATPEEEKQFFKNLTGTLVEKGIFQAIELEEGEEIDEDKFIELQDLEVESRVEESFDAFFEQLDADAVAFMKFKRAGGSTQAFMKAYASSLDLPTADLETDEGQKAILRHYYKTVEHVEEEDIESKIDWAVENKKLEKYAKKYHDLMEEEDRKKKDQLLIDLKRKEEEEVQKRQGFEKNISDTLATAKTISGMTFTKEDRDSKNGLIPYIVKPTVKVAKNKYITGLQADIQKLWGKPELLVLAKLVKNQLDLSSIKEKGATELVEKVRRTGLFQGRTRGLSGSEGGGKSLAERF